MAAREEVAEAETSAVSAAAAFAAGVSGVRMTLWTVGQAEAECAAGSCSWSDRELPLATARRCRRS